MKIRKKLKESVAGQIKHAQQLLEHAIDKNSQTAREHADFVGSIQASEVLVRSIAHEFSEQQSNNTNNFALVLQSLFENHKQISSAKITFFAEANFNWNVLSLPNRARIYFIVQRLIQNAYLRGDAANIYIEVELESAHLLVSVHDDGRGFNIAKLRKGRGLREVDQRLKELNGSIDLLSKINIGTTALLKIPCS